MKKVFKTTNTMLSSLAALYFITFLSSSYASMRMDDMESPTTIPILFQKGTYDYYLNLAKERAKSFVVFCKGESDGYSPPAELPQYFKKESRGINERNYTITKKVYTRICENGFTQDTLIGLIKRRYSYAACRDESRKNLLLIEPTSTKNINKLSRLVSRANDPFIKYKLWTARNSTDTGSIQITV